MCEKTMRSFTWCFLTSGAALQPCPWSWSLPGLHYRHSHVSLADPDLALLTWLPSLTSGLCHHSRLPWWSLDYLADPGYRFWTYSALLVTALWDCTPCWWDHGPSLSLQFLALLLWSNLSCCFLTEGCSGGRSKIKVTLFLEGIWYVNINTCIP